MAKININQSGKYSGGEGAEFFSLKDDGDTARVRLLYDQEDGSDLDYFLVHQVEINGKKRYVDCLAVQEDGTMDTHKCPLCQSGNPRQEKLFLQLYNEDEDKLQVWERGRTFVAKVQSLINRFGSLVGQTIEIERNGKKGSQSTTYSFYPYNSDGKTLDDFPEKQDLTSKLIIEANEEDMEKIINGTYRVAGEQDSPVERRDSRRSEDRERPQRHQRPQRSNDDIY